MVRFVTSCQQARERPFTDCNLRLLCFSFFPSTNFLAVGISSKDSCPHISVSLLRPLYSFAFRFVTICQPSSSSHDRVPSSSRDPSQVSIFICFMFLLWCFRPLYAYPERILPSKTLLLSSIIRPQLPFPPGPPFSIDFADRFWFSRVLLSCHQFLLESPVDQQLTSFATVHLSFFLLSSTSLPPFFALVILVKFQNVSPSICIGLSRTPTS